MVNSKAPATSGIPGSNLPPPTTSVLAGQPSKIVSWNTPGSDIGTPKEKKAEGQKKKNDLGGV